MTTTYRPDIDGLRAVAVIPVVLFHSKISLSGAQLFPGGFVGVDIFFVISGYLISNILLHDIGRNQFSILKFYERRIRRILPALFTMLLFAACAAWLVLLPGANGEMDYFGTHLFGSAFFYSNYQFMFEKGYFSPAAENNPLLHLWSLAVEEQFYIVFPLYLYLASRFFRDRLGLATIAILLVSLIYSIWLVRADANAAFYSSPARAWELMIGAVLAIFPRTAPLDQRLAQALSVTGLGLILYSILFYHETAPFPGEAALLPCVGAALLIFTGQNNPTWTGRLLSTNTFRYPGLISYSLYLWHWPVLVFYRFYAITEITKLEMGMLFAFMTAAAWASWKYAEAPFRTRAVLANRKPLFAAAAGMMLIFAGFGAFVSLNEGLSARLPQHAIEQLLAAKDDYNNYSKQKGCEVLIPRQHNLNDETISCMIGAAEPATASFAVWGDSHAEMLTPVLDAAAKQAGIKGVLLRRHACPPLLGFDSLEISIGGCPDSALAAMKYLMAHPEISAIILVSRWAVYMEGRGFKNELHQKFFTRDSFTQSLSSEENRQVFKRTFERTLTQLLTLGRKVVVVTAVPEAGFNIPDSYARAAMFNRVIDLRPTLTEYMDRQAHVHKVFDDNRNREGLSFIRPHEAMCDAEYCPVLDNGRPVYHDDDHLTLTYAKKLSHLFDPVFQNIADENNLSLHDTAR